MVLGFMVDLGSMVLGKQSLLGLLVQALELRLVWLVWLVRGSVLVRRPLLRLLLRLLRPLVQSRNPWHSRLYLA